MDFVSIQMVLVEAQNLTVESLVTFREFMKLVIGFLNC